LPQGSDSDPDPAGEASARPMLYLRDLLLRGERGWGGEEKGRKLKGKRREGERRRKEGGEGKEGGREIGRSPVKPIRARKVVRPCSLPAISVGFITHN